MSIYNLWGKTIFKSDALVGRDKKFSEVHVAPVICISFIGGHFKIKMKKSDTV